MTRLQRFRVATLEGWRSANGWLRAFFLWSIAWSIISLMVVKLHAPTPGHYNSPEKVSIRTTIADIKVVGALILMAIGIWKATKRATRDKMRDRDPGTTP